MNKAVDQLWHEYVEECGTKDIRICPICSYCGKFVSNAIGKENNVCPNCQSNPRARLYYVYILNYDVLSGPRKIIGVSPDKATRCKILQSKGTTPINYTVIGPDEVVKNDFGSGEIDFLMANYILDRVSNKSQMLSEIWRILKDDGIAMLSVFFKNVGDTTKTEHYTEEEYVDLLKNNRFDVKLLTSSEVCGGPLESFIFGIGPKDKVVIATKKI